MELAELIRSRRSIGTFTDTPVPVELIQELLDTAVYAPNHRMTEPWRFILITGEARQRYATIRSEMVLDSMTGKGEIERQQAAEGTYAKFATIPAYLVVAMKIHPDPETHEEDYGACCCVIQNFLLLAWERGLGTSWKTFKNDARLREFVGLAGDEKVVGIVHLGYPAEEKRSGQRQPVNERLTVLDL